MQQKYSWRSMDMLLFRVAAMVQKMGDNVPRGEESYSTNKGCSDQGSCCPIAVVAEIEAKTYQAWSHSGGMLDTKVKILMI